MPFENLTSLNRKPGKNLQASAFLDNILIDLHLLFITKIILTKIKQSGFHFYPDDGVSCLVCGFFFGIEQRASSQMFIIKFLFQLNFLICFHHFLLAHCQYVQGCQYLCQCVQECHYYRDLILTALSILLVHNNQKNRWIWHKDIQIIIRQHNFAENWILH